MTRPSGLGRGLSALIPAAGPGQSGLLRVPLAQLRPNPRQPRERFDPAALEELSRSLRQVGMLQPIVVRPGPDGGYEIVAGERRFRAAAMAGLDEVPVVVRRTEDDQLLTEALVENVHRADLDALEEAAAYQQLIDDFGLTHDALAAKLGRSRSAITNSLRLLGLPRSLQDLLGSGTLTAGHARALLGLPDAAQQERAAARVVAEGLSVRATEELVRRLTATPARGDDALEELAEEARRRKASPFLHVERRLGDALGTKVAIRGTERRGRVVIEYAGREDLDRLLDAIARGTGTDVLD